MQQVFEYLRENRDKILHELETYLRIPSISSDPDHKKDMIQCAEFTVDMLKRAGLDNIKINTTEGHPVVTGEWLKADGKPTVLIYGHYDVQPVDPLDLWEKDPFEPHIRNDRIIARGSADDKGQIFMHIKTIEAILNTTGALPVNVKMVIEGEEEVGSPNLTPFLEEFKDNLKSDVAMVSDSGMFAEGMPAITYGLKGLTYLEIQLTGPDRDLHSGTFGGAVANPAEMLARLLAEVKDENGRIQIPGFYDKVLEITDTERKLNAQIPHNDDAYMKDLGVEELWGEKPYTTLERAGARPTFEINGIWSGFTGKGAKTVLPSVANAKVSSRLVPNQDPDEIAALTEKFFRELAPKSVKVKVTRHHGGRPTLVPLDNPYLESAKRAMYEAFDREPLFLREGGSIPIVADFKSILGVETLLLGFALPDARAHSPNENFHLPTFYTGMECLVRTMFYIGE